MRRESWFCIRQAVPPVPTQIVAVFIGGDLLRFIDPHAVESHCRTLSVRLFAVDPHAALDGAAPLPDSG